jgi:hypothetical protein
MGRYHGCLLQKAMKGHEKMEVDEEMTIESINSIKSVKQQQQQSSSGAGEVQVEKKSKKVKEKATTSSPSMEMEVEDGGDANAKKVG